MVHPGRSYPRRSIGIELNPQDNSLYNETVLVGLVNQLIADSQERDQEIRGQVDHLTNIVLDIQRQLSAVLNSNSAARTSSPNHVAHPRRSAPRSSSPEPHSSAGAKPELMLVDEPESVPESTANINSTRRSVSSPSAPPPTPDPSQSRNDETSILRDGRTSSDQLISKVRRCNGTSLSANTPTSHTNGPLGTTVGSTDETVDALDISTPSQDDEMAPVDSQSGISIEQVGNTESHDTNLKKHGVQSGKQGVRDKNISRRVIRVSDLLTQRDEATPLITDEERPSDHVTNVDAAPLVPSPVYRDADEINNQYSNKAKKSMPNPDTEKSHLKAQMRVQDISAEHDSDDPLVNRNESTLPPDAHDEQATDNPVSRIITVSNKENSHDHVTEITPENNGDEVVPQKVSVMQSVAKLLDSNVPTLIPSRDKEHIPSAEVPEPKVSLMDVTLNNELQTDPCILQSVEHETNDALREPIPAWILTNPESSAVDTRVVGGPSAHPNSVSGEKSKEQLVSRTSSDRHPTSESNPQSLQFSFDAVDSELGVDVSSDVAMTQEERTTAFEACVTLTNDRSEGGTDVPNTPLAELEELVPTSAETQPTDPSSAPSTMDAQPYHQKSKQLPSIEVIVISDNDDDDDLCATKNSHNDVCHQDKEEDKAISPSQLRGTDSNDRCSTPLQSSSKSSKKRRRVSMPFTNSMLGRNVSYQDQHIASPELSSSEASSDEDQEESEIDKEPTTPVANSLGPDFTPMLFRSRRSCTPSEGDLTPRRPSKVQRSENGNLTSEECEAYVHEAHLLLQDFYKENGSNPRDVVELLDQAASSGSLVAMARLGQIYVKGIIGIAPGALRIRRNFSKALHYVTMALKEDSSYPPALNIRGDLWMISRGKRSTVTQKAIRLYKKSALQGDADGQCKLGQWWLSSFAYAATESRRRTCLQNAMIELKKAVDMNSGKAASLLGSIYENDGGMQIYNETIDLVEGRAMSFHERSMKAKGLYFQSMNWNCAEGTNDVAACYEVAYADVERNFDMAAELYRRSFELGHLGAAANLALLYELGAKNKFRDRVDRELALKWYKIGNRVHCPVATSHLASVYDNGTLAEENKTAAERLYEAAINYADDRGKDLDIIPRVQEDLSALYITKALLQKPDANEAIKKLKKMRCNSKSQGAQKVASAKKHLGWLAAAELDHGLYGHMQSAQLAIPSLVSLLGEKNAAEVVLYVRTLCEDVKQQSSDSADSRARLHGILDSDVLSMIGL